MVCLEDDLLFRYFQSPKVSNKKSKTKKETFGSSFVPPCYGFEFGHYLDLVGHLGIKKTTDGVMSNFYWPGVQGNVGGFCMSDDICQRTLPKGKVTPIPLESMPFIETPFERVAVDLVGPIFTATDRGNKYILTMAD